MTDQKTIGIIEAGFGGVLAFALLFVNVVAWVVIGPDQSSLESALAFSAVLLVFTGFFGFIAYDGYRRYKGKKDVAEIGYVVLAVLVLMALLMLF